MCNFTLKKVQIGLDFALKLVYHSIIRREQQRQAKADESTERETKNATQERERIREIGIAKRHRYLNSHPPLTSETS